MGGGAKINLGFLNDIAKEGKKGVSNISNEINKGIGNIASELSNGTDSLLDGVNKTLEERNKVITRTGVEIGNGFRDLTGANAMQRGMEENARNQERQANRLLWEKENNEALAKEKDLQEEARKRLRAEATSGRAGTILTGSAPVSNTSLGASSGKSLLGQ